MSVHNRLTLVWAVAAVLGASACSGAAGGDGELGTGGGKASGSGGSPTGSGTGGTTASGTGGTNSGSGGAASGGNGSGSGGANASGGSGSGGVGPGTGGGTTATGGAGGSSASGGNGGSGSGSGGAGGRGTQGVCGGGVPFDAAARSKCTGTSPISCHLGETPGDYEVTVELGGTSAGNTFVYAEANRRMLGAVSTTAGQTQCFTFIVNVREQEGQPVNDQQKNVSSKAGLDVYFGGTAPQLKSIGYRKAQNPKYVYIAGDSTVCDQQDRGYAGWGQFLPQKLNETVSVVNLADSGESSTSFLANNQMWGAIKSRMKTGDTVFVQFGHNDKNGATSDTQFKANMNTYVNDAKAKGAFPILVTPIARATFDGNTLTQQHGNFPAIIRQVGKDQNVPVIDLTAITSEWLMMVGPKGWQPYHANGTDGPDPTHPNQAGADMDAGRVADAIAKQDIAPVKGYLR